MTITSTPSEVSYQGDDVSTSFPIPYVFDTAADLKVVRTDSDGNISVLTTGWSVSGGNGSTGTLILDAPLGAGDKLTIIDDPQAKQDTDYVANDSFPAETHERALDYLTRLIKRLLTKFERTLRVADGDPAGGSGMEIGSVQNRKGKFLYFDDTTGAPTVAAAVGVQPLTQSIIGEQLYPQTAAEIAAGVTPTNYAYPPLHILRYGANTIPGTTDMTAAIQAACDSVPPGGGTVTGPAEIMLVTSTIDVNVGNTTIELPRGGGFTAGAGVTMFVFNADRWKLKGVRFESTETSTTTATGAFRAFDVEDGVVEDCTFGRVLMGFRSTNAATLSRAIITRCKFEGDYTGTSGVDVNNVIEFRGITEVIFSHNTVVSPGNFYRLIKCSMAVVGGNPIVPDHASKRVVISDNVIHLTGGVDQQMIDFSYGTSELVVADNNITIDDNASVAFVFQGKATQDTGSGNGSTPNNVKISDNVLKLGNEVAVAFDFESNWGLNGFDKATRISVTDNIIDTADDGVAAQISCKGFNSAVIAGNVINKPAGTAFSRGISVSNCQRTVIANNELHGGNIEIVGSGSTSDGDLYANSPESIDIHDNIIEDFLSQGGISFFNISGAEEITIHDNHIRNQTDNATVQAAIYFNTVTTAVLNMHDNRLNLANGSKNVWAGSLSVTTHINHDNSWNFATVTWDPGSLSDGAGETSPNITAIGAALGDWVRVAAPYDLTDCTVTAYVREANTIKIRLQNESGATRDFGSGTWRVTWGKG